ncbi:MAG: PAS domain S-box protein [Deltaproteobacteria bacterium]|nr:MAG: PAS domain S-box protein [Deltaproteobacteria bacterium]
MNHSAPVPWQEAEQPPGRILVVDDVEGVRSLCAELIHNIGLEMATAPDSSHAKDLLAREPFALVVSDIAMPGVDGLQLARFVKEHYPETDIILMTAFNMRYSFEEVLAAGAIDFIQKPFSKDEFEAKLKRVLRERRQLRTIQRSERHFRTLLENIPGVVFSLFADGRSHFLDDKIKDLTGYPADAFSDEPGLWSSLFGENNSSFVAELHQSSSEQQRSLVREYLIRDRKGRRRWLEVRGQPVSDDQGNTEHINGILFDITHQKRLEKLTSGLNQLFLSFGTDHSANIHKVVVEAGNLLSAACSIYYRTERNGMEATLTLAHAGGRVEEERGIRAQTCPLLSKIMRNSAEQPELFDNLGQDPDLQLDYLVDRYQLNACIAKPLLVSGQIRGSFCVAFSAPHTVLPHELAMFSMLAKALEIEEERRDLQEAIIRSEDKHRSLVEGNLYPITIIDGRGVICYCNTVMAALFRYPNPSLLVDRDFMELVHPEDHQKVAELIRRVNRHPTVHSERSLDFRGVDSDAATVDIRITVGKTSYDGRPALQAILEDVTQRKHTEQALRDSEERYRTLVEGANDAVFLETFDGRLVDVNTKACQMLGYARDDLLHRKMVELVYREDGLAAQEPRDGGESQQREETMARRDGSRIPVEVNTSVLKLKGEKYVMSVVRDITLRKEKELRQKHLEQAIIESKNRLMAVFDGIMSPLTILDLDYNIIMVNKATASLFGDTIPSFLGRKCYEAYHNRKEPCANCPVNETIRTGKASHRLSTNPVINRTMEEYTYPVFDASGNLSLIIDYGIDVTDKIKMEKQLIQADKMASLGTLAAGIAHEIRNPMATINLNTQILLRDLQLDQEHQVYMLDIQREVKKIERIISEILEFSKPKPAHLVETNINEVVRSVHELTRVQLRKHGVLVHFDLDESLPPVLIDPAQISQVLINLVINAMQAIPEGGDLTVTTQLDPASSRVELLVSDTGVGIPAENLDKIFDPFFTNKPEGTGLGLAIARQMLDKNQAAINVSSKVNQGTTFRTSFKTLVT